MSKLKLKIYTFIITILIISPLIVGVSGGTIYAAAETVSYEYTDVLEDLDKDESFNPDNYPEIADDYSLDIITIAESENRELFIYVYQPSGQGKDLRASSINISTETGDDIAYYNYGLRYLNSDGVFYKYIVKGFTVSGSDVRYYSITSIYRPFDDTIDDQADYDNKITEVSYNISKQYGLSTVDGQTVIECVDIETIEITDKLVGYVIYPNGFYLNLSRCHSHFVAFNTDKDIDKLLEADVYYTTQSYYSYTAPLFGTDITWGDKLEKHITLSYEDSVEHTTGGLFSALHKTYTWDRIETVDQFISEVNNASVPIFSGVILDVSLGSQITEDGMKALQGKQWVLRFAETSFNQDTNDGVTTSSRTLVGDVTILRLKFESDGKTYNLGVVDNKQTGSDKPINEWSGLIVTPKFWVIAIIIVAVLVLIYFAYNKIRDTQHNKES